MTKNTKSIRLEIPVELHALLKSQAALQRITLERLIIDALTKWRFLKGGKP